jgi:hypothetical protein
MNDLSQIAVNAIQRASDKLGPVSALLDKLAETLVPHVTASACAGSECVYETCTNIRCAHGMVGYHYYSTAPRGCQQGIYTCRVASCFC